MTGIHTHGRLAGALAVTLAIAAAGPASARTFYFNQAGSLVQQTLPNSPQATAPGSPSSSSDWSYAAIGAGATGLVVIAVGGKLATGRRRERPTDPQRSAITP